MKNKLLWSHHCLRRKQSIPLVLLLLLRAFNKVALSGFDTIWFCYIFIIRKILYFFCFFSLSPTLFLSILIESVFFRSPQRRDLQFCYKMKMKIFPSTIEKQNFSRIFIPLKSKSLSVTRWRHDPVLLLLFSLSIRSRQYLLKSDSLLLPAGFLLLTSKSNEKRFPCLYVFERMNKHRNRFE